MIRFSGSLPEEGRNVHVPPQSDFICNAVAAANTMVRIPIPEGANVVFILAEPVVFGKFGNSAVTVAVPTASVLNGTGAEIMNSVRAIPDDATHLAVIASTALVASLAFYA